MKYLFLAFLCLAGTAVSGQQFLNGSFEPVGTISTCTEVSGFGYDGQMGNSWLTGGTNSAFLADNTCGAASAGTHYIGLEYNSVTGGTTIIFKLSYPMVAGNTYKFSFDYKLPPSGGAATVFFGYNNPADSLGHDSLITFRMPPSSSSWVTLTDSIKPKVNTQWFFIRAGTMGSSPLMTMVDNFSMQCTAPPHATFSSVGTHTVNFTYTDPATPDSVKWNFGDGGTSTALNPMHVFTAAGTHTVCVTAYNGCGNNAKCQTVTTTLGIDEMTGSTYSLYPNPVSGILTIKGAAAGTNYNIADAFGRIVFLGTIAKEEEAVEMTHLPAGRYLVIMVDPEGNRNVWRVVKE